MTDAPKHRGGRPPIPDRTRQRILQLAREGLACNEIARRCEVSAMSVSRICKREGIQFDRAQTAAATAAAVTDAKALRAELALSFALEAKATLKRLHEPHVVIGWYQGTASEHELPAPLSADVRNYLLAAAIAVDKHLVLADHDGKVDTSAVGQWLDWVMGGGTLLPGMANAGPTTDSG